MVDSDKRLMHEIMMSVFNQMPKSSLSKTIVFIEEKPPKKLINEILSLVTEFMPDHINFNHKAEVFEGVKFVVFSFSNKYANVIQESGKEQKVIEYKLDTESFQEKMD